MRTLRTATRGALATAFGCLVLLFAAVPAMAGYIHPTSAGSFGADGTAASTIPGLHLLTFDQTRHRLYTLNAGPPKVSGFSVPSVGVHTPLPGFPFSVAEGGYEPDIAVDSGTGNIFMVSTQGGLYGYDPTTGTALPGAFPVHNQQEVDCGVAVDSEGHVWVADKTAEKIKEYTQTGEPIGTPVNTPLDGNGPCRIAFDLSNDDMYVAGFSAGTYRYTAASGYTQRVQIHNNNTGSIAVDSRDHVLYSTNFFGNGVSAYDPQGHLLDNFATGAPAGASYGIAFDESTRAVYLSNPVNGKVLVYPALAVPDVTTGEQTGNATLNGTVDPGEGGPITECKFEYGIHQEFTGGPHFDLGSLPCDQATPITSPTNVTADASSVATFEQEYDYRLTVKDANGTVHGLGQIFTVHGVSALATEPASAISRESATLNGSYIGTNESTTYSFEWGTSPNELSNSTPFETHGKTTGPTTISTVLGDELDPGTEYFYRVVATNNKATSRAKIVSFTTVPAVLGVTTSPPTDVAKESAVLNGSFTGDGNDTKYFFEYGSSTAYGRTTPEVSAGVTTGPTTADPTTITELVPGKEYHFRLVATNGFGTTHGNDVTFETISPPVIVGASSSGLTATTADLEAVINPRGAETTYRFEYGPTTDYGSSAPLPPGVMAAGTVAKRVTVHLEGLTRGAVYHFRVVATNANGEAVTADQVFNFYPEPCPNDTVRQQTRADSLPDCRAYELVTPENAGNAVLYGANMPFSSTATSPSRAAFVAAFGVVPGVDGSSNVQGDMYVSTRGPSGWVSQKVGLPVTQAYISGGPPWLTGGSSPDKWYLDVATNPSMSKVVMWNDGYFPETYTREEEGVESSNAPYLFDSTTGGVVDRWPTNLGAIPGGQYFKGMTLTSEDLNHFIFKSSVPFLPGAAAGTLYDNNTTDETLKAVSLNEANKPIDAAPVEVSSNGSHILMTVGGARTEYLPTNGAGELFMRVNDERTYDIAKGKPVQFAGMTPDGSTVYFLSNEDLTEDESDTDSSVDLYQWSEKSSAPNHLKLISKGTGDSGNSDSCGASWTANCNVVPIFMTTNTEAGGYSGAFAGIGGSPYSDNALADNGDIFFISPEQLVGDNGVTAAENLYDFHDGKLHFVTALEPGSPSCSLPSNCSETSVARIEVSPDGEHMAFLTSSKVTAYDNAGFSEIYTYEPATGQITCASCLANNAVPASNVTASHNGLFMTDDGRVFFETTDAVVPADTNEVADVYEFVDSRQRLISGGTGPGPNENTISTFGPGGARPGLLGVSADGTDVYFATYDVLVGQDRNGDSIKVYDARTGGGFPFVAPRQGCAAADECHGAGSPTPATALNGTGASLGSSGNLKPAAKKGKAHKKKGLKASPKRHRRKSGGHRNG